MKPQGYRWLPVSFVALTRSSCSTIRKNFVLVYELLDEMVDYGARHRGQRLNHQYLWFFPIWVATRLWHDKTEIALSLTWITHGSIEWIWSFRITQQAVPQQRQSGHTNFPSCLHNTRSERQRPGKPIHLRHSTQPSDQQQHGVFLLKRFTSHILPQKVEAKGFVQD